MKHIRFECEDCECENKNEGLLEKHNSAVHGSVKIFCHYFNNDKECPFDDQCTFSHEESPECKFGGECERILCMFQHDENDDSENEDDNEDDKETNGHDDGDTVEENVITIDDIEPSLKRVEDAMEKVNMLLKKHALKCEFCEF